MQINPEILLTILGMALVTYATRISGFWLMGRVTISKRVEAWLSFIPGAVLVSIIAPGILTGGPAEWIAAIGTTLVAVRTGQLIPAMVVGVVLVVILRTFLGIP